MVNGRCDDNPDFGTKVESALTSRVLPQLLCFVPVFVPDGGAHGKAFVTKLRRTDVRQVTHRVSRSVISPLRARSGLPNDMQLR
jgi:hypothetical protein